MEDFPSQWLPFSRNAEVLATVDRNAVARMQIGLDDPQSPSVVTNKPTELTYWLRVTAEWQMESAIEIPEESDGDFSE